MDQQQVIDWCGIARRHTDASRSCTVFRILDDATDFYDVNYGDVLLLNNRGYLVKGSETEKKFGLEGEPKPWVKNSVDLVTGERKILKLTFLEEFTCSIDSRKFTCLRNPEKESRILHKIRGHDGFMQGFHVIDAAGNNIRILDRIQGTSLDVVVRSIPGNHRKYYETELKNILTGLALAFQNLSDLHDMGEIHGDITPDHLFLSKHGRNYVWIDFDYDYRDYKNLIERDIYEIGIILAFVIGKQYTTYHDVRKHSIEGSKELTPGDMLIVLRNQLANLKILYPYIDDELNNILLRFSLGSNIRYQSARQIADDLARAIQRM